MSSLPIVFWEASKITVSFALFICLLKIAGDYYMGRHAGSDLNPLLYFLAPVKDIVIGLIWFVPLVSATVVWRGNRFLIGKNSLLSPCPENGLLSWTGVLKRIPDALRLRS
jgi:hypothetical protein